MARFDVSIPTVEQVIQLLKDNQLTEITLESGDNKISIKSEKEMVAAAPVAAAPVATAATPQAAPTEEKAAVCLPAETGHIITSPMVGTFYRSPSPNSPSFVEVGDTVNCGQKLCIIEAMKLMNELESDVSGRIKKILIEDGQPVEYGQALFEMEAN